MGRGLGVRLLKQYWGYDTFRGIQEDIINSITEGRDTLGLMPTGGGKSITFQVPALAKEGLCLVITPLIALMKDQVQNLKKRGIKALAIYSGMSRQEIIVTLENCIFGNFKFLYISPERLDTEIFRTKLQKMKNQYDYGRRKPLHIAMGLRFPSRLSEDSRNTRTSARRTHPGIDSHRHSGSSERYPGPSAFP